MSLSAFLNAVAFRGAVWLCPVAFTLHVIEEAPRFTPWVNRYINGGFTQRDYYRVHIGGIVTNVVIAGLLTLFPWPWLVFLCFAFALAPAFLCNIFFHAGASAVYRSYSPGLVTTLTIYPPLFFALTRSALHEGLLSPSMLVIAIAIAAVFHALEVAHNTFGVRLLGGIDRHIRSAGVRARSVLLMNRDASAERARRSRAAF
jgi:uncharacterized protein with HXXEE motif